MDGTAAKGMDIIMKCCIYHEPRMILDKLIKNEEMLVSLYYELTKDPPPEHLKKTIAHMSQHQKAVLEKIKMLVHHFPPV